MVAYNLRLKLDTKTLQSLKVINRLLCKRLKTVLLFYLDPDHLSLLQILLKTLQKRKLILMNLSVQKLKINALFTNNAKKSSMSIKKKQTKALRSGKAKETKTQRITKIFYKFLGKIFDQ